MGLFDQRVIPAPKVANDLGDLAYTDKPGQSGGLENLKQDSCQVTGRRWLRLRGHVSHDKMGVQKKQE